MMTSNAVEPIVQDLLSQRIERVLFRAGWTKTMVAERLHIAPHGVSNRFNGKTRWTVGEVYELAEHLEVPLSTLFPPKEDVWIGS